VLLAERSDKSAVENQEHVRFALKIGQSDGFSLEIFERKIRSGGIQGYFWHVFLHKAE
jgi:hypothetical protein